MSDPHTYKGISCVHSQYTATCYQLSVVIFGNIALAGNNKWKKKKKKKGKNKKKKRRANKTTHTQTTNTKLTVSGKVLRKNISEYNDMIMG